MALPRLKTAMAFSILVVAACAPPPDPSSFNVILVTLDTTRADRIGAFGGKAVPTPHLDAMAREGTRFATAISQVPLTLPSHASILTGRYPAGHGVRHNGAYRLSDSEETLAEKLQGAGFHTAAFVGAYVLNAQYGTAQGFETYDDIPTDRYAGGRDNLYEAQRTADDVNARVLAWLANRPQGRFFLWVHYYDPHLPYGPPESSKRTLAGTGYDREISYVDACFGDLMDALRAQGLLDRSVLVVAGDHGESLGEHRELSHGVFLYEGAVHVPLLIRAPGLVRKGGVVEEPVQLVDVAPTVLDLLRVGPLAAAQGTSLAARMHGDRGEALAYAETFMPRIEFGWSELRMVRGERYKYILAPKPELYDLRADPGENRNLVQEDPERGSEMAAMIEEWVGATTNKEREVQAKRTLTGDEEARLRSLGYLGGQHFKTGGDEGTALPDPKDRIEEGRLLTEARDKLTGGQPEEALREIEELIRRNPMNHLALTSRVQALVQLRRLDEAERAAEVTLAAALSEKDAAGNLEEQARRALASVLWMVGKNSAAEEEYRRAIELNQKSHNAPIFGGLLLGAAGGKEEAMRLVNGVLERNPRDGMAMAARFELELASGDKDAAVRTARSLAELHAGDPDTLVKAGVLARDRNDAALAVALFEEADRKKRSDPDILGYLGTARLSAGDLDGAERALGAAKDLRPDDPRAPFYLGNIALLRNQEKQARELFSEALRRDPKFTPPLLNLGKWLAEKHRIDEAIEVVQDALRRRPQDEQARGLLDSWKAGRHRSAGGTP